MREKLRTVRETHRIPHGKIHHTGGYPSSPEPMRSLPKVGHAQLVCPCGQPLHDHRPADPPAKDYSWLDRIDLNTGLLR